MFRRRFLTAAAVAAVAVLYSAPRADAAFLQVTLIAPGGSVTVTDGQLGVDIDPLANSIALAPTVVGSYRFTGSVATTNSPGDPTVASIFADVLATSTTGADPTTTDGLIQVVVSSNGFNSPQTPPDITATTGATFQVSAVGTQNGNGFDVSVNSFLDTNDVLSTAGVGTPIGVDGPVTITASSGNTPLGDSQLIGTLTGGFALNLVLSANANNEGRNAIDLDGTLTLNPVPAPGALVLLGTAVPFVGLLRRRLRRTTETTVAA